MRYKVRARMPSGNRITTTKFWSTKKGAQAYASATNKAYYHANARVIEAPKRRRYKK